MCHVGHLLDGDDGAQHVGDVAHRHDLRAVGEEALVGLEVDLAAVGDGDLDDPATLANGELLPGHDVGVVLQLGDQDVVTLLHPCVAVCPRHQVDGAGVAVGKDDLTRLRGAEEAGRGDARVLVGLAGLLAQQVDAAMDVGVAGFVVGADGVNDRARLLGAGGAVQIHERAAVGHPVEDGKVGPDPGHIKHRRGGHLPLRSLRPAAPSPDG